MAGTVITPSQRRRFEKQCRKGPAGGYHPSHRGATHWLMKNVHAPFNTWVTKGRYYRDEVQLWDNARPIVPIIND